MNIKEKTVIPNLSVGADKEQPSVFDNKKIITSGELECKYLPEANEEWVTKLRSMIDPYRLPTVTLNQLYDTSYKIRQPLIEGLLYPGTYLFVGAPKIGKSFLMAQLAYHVSTGKTLWGYDVREGTVLYLALEDDYRRLQERLYRMFGVEGSDNLHFSIEAKQLGVGLCEQLRRFVQEYPGTRLIIIDTLQKVRETGGNKYSYASDYETISQLKAFTDCRDICLLLVHHTRKQQADDKYDSISGTNGLLGAADGAFILGKEKRVGNSAILEVSGRDQAEQRLLLNKDIKKLTWELERAEIELWKSPPDPIMEKLVALLNDTTQEWSGTATELIATLQLDIAPNRLTKYLNVNTSRLFNEHQIRYEYVRRHSGRKIILKK